MSISWFVPMLIGFLALILIMISWRASLTIVAVTSVHIFGMLVSAIPPVSILNQVAVHAAIGLGVGVIVCAGRDRSEVRRLPLLASLVVLLVTASWVGSIKTFVADLWLFAARALVLPVAMYLVIWAAQRHLVAKDKARSRPA